MRVLQKCLCTAPVVCQCSLNVYARTVRSRDYQALPGQQHSRDTTASSNQWEQGSQPHIGNTRKMVHGAARDRWKMRRFMGTLHHHGRRTPGSLISQPCQRTTLHLFTPFPPHRSYPHNQRSASPRQQAGASTSCRTQKTASASCPPLRRGCPSPTVLPGSAGREAPRQ